MNTYWHYVTQFLGFRSQPGGFLKQVIDGYHGCPDNQRDRGGVNNK